MRLGYFLPFLGSGAGRVGARVGAGGGAGVVVCGAAGAACAAGEAHEAREARAWLGAAEGFAEDADDVDELGFRLVGAGLAQAAEVGLVELSLGDVAP